MPNSSKIKGDTEERSVVNKLRDKGFTCKRTLEAGARSDGSSTHDIDLYYGDNQLLLGECKIRKSGFKFIYEALGTNDFLTIRTNNNARLFVLPEDVFIKLLGAH